tara:strand:+ start:5348 stop:5908 length:561 start_codon:yes stop_codon:yes gene_type:complete
MSRRKVKKKSKEEIGKEFNDFLKKKGINDNIWDFLSDNWNVSLVRSIGEAQTGYNVIGKHEDKKVVERIKQFLEGDNYGSKVAALTILSRHQGSIKKEKDGVTKKKVEEADNINPQESNRKIKKDNLSKVSKPSVIRRFTDAVRNTFTKKKVGGKKRKTRKRRRKRTKKKRRRKSTKKKRRKRRRK